ncbi:hypothetical protein HDU82_006562 [Entophlyctis luteolus]|nr:hypothetical protein HDU82_006562 [Entophlyctis luteolus]
MADSDLALATDAIAKLDSDKLRDIGCAGFPEGVRAASWKLLLLGVEAVDSRASLNGHKAYQLETSIALERQGSEVIKRIRGEVSRYCKARARVSFKAENLSACIENVVSAYLAQSRGQEYFPAMMADEASVYFCFIALMNLVDAYYSKKSLADRMAELSMLLRTLLPDLHSHFEEEEVDFKACASGWFQFFLSKELPLESLLRLWDTYLCAPDGFELHVYVCLAILSALKENLEELEQSEIHGVLLRLPNMDMDNIINQAMTLRDEVRIKKLVVPY